MLSTTLDLTRIERKIVKQAFLIIYPSLKKGEFGQYKLAADKLENEVIEVDGCFMRCMENALRFAADQSNYKLVKIIHESLAAKIQQQREAFQKKAMSRLLAS